MPDEALIWIDGVESKLLPLPDRGVDYGDGLFETLLLVDGRPIYFDLHLQRLNAGLGALGFPFIGDEIVSQIQHILRSHKFPAQASMRISITRGAGPRGYAIPENTQPRVIVSVSPLADLRYQQLQAPAHLSLASIAWGHQPKLAGIKHLNRLEQVLAASERQRLGADEVVMLDQDKHIVSVSAGNLFLLIDQALHTPRLVNCGVHGTRRRLVLERFSATLNIPVHESELLLSHFDTASEVFFCNALVGFRPVASFGELKWSSHRVCNSIHQLYCEQARQ